MLELSIVHRGRRVVVAPEAAPPFVPDAIVLEEDTFLVLSADTEVREPRAHPLSIFTALLDLQPHAIGEVIEEGGVPRKVFAVVHDTALDPTTTTENVATAMDAVGRLVAERRWSKIGLEVLGTIHGRLALEHVLPKILDALPEGIEVWLIPREGQEDAVRAWLRAP